MMQECLPRCRNCLIDIWTLMAHYLQ